jgi:NADPH2:quinone reductase
MRAWVVDAWGEPEQMRLAEVAAPEVRDGDVRIEIRAAGVNFFDILQVQGKYQIKPPFPFTPGAEIAGVVAGTGERVAALCQQGGFAEAVAVPRERVFPLPGEMSFEEAACLLVYHTSRFALHTRAAMAPGEWLLVHAGASGVGMAAIQIGKAMGARVIATASSREKLDFCRAQGADHAIPYTAGDWVERVKETTGGRGADVIYDSVGGDVFDLSSRCIAPEGRLLVVGFASGRIPSIAANRILLKDISIVGVAWGAYAFRRPAYLRETHEELMRMFASGDVRPAIGRRFPLEEAPKALRALADRQVLGKAILVTV